VFVLVLVFVRTVGVFVFVSVGVAVVPPVDSSLILSIKTAAALLLLLMKRINSKAVWPASIISASGTLAVLHVVSIDVPVVR